MSHNLKLVVLSSWIKRTHKFILKKVLQVLMKKLQEISLVDWKKFHHKRILIILYRSN